MKMGSASCDVSLAPSCRLRIAGLQAGRSRNAASTQRRQLETVLRSGWQTLAVQETQPWRTYNPACQSSTNNTTSKQRIQIDRSERSGPSSGAAVSAALKI